MPAPLKLERKGAWPITCNVEPSSEMNPVGASALIWGVRAIDGYSANAIAPAIAKVKARNHGEPLALERRRNAAASGRSVAIPLCRVAIEAPTATPRRTNDESVGFRTSLSEARTARSVTATAPLGGLACCEYQR